ncbi:O-antigen ligase family protein [Pseudonocardia zijingensis]|uniref:O-antigen ligase family protein n=1 Tax=Pseudonocardia zijingensis TaxID=153376 RepID=UPI0031D8DBB5
MTSAAPLTPAFDEDRGRWSVRDVLAPTALVTLLFAGYFKELTALAWLPVDLTLLALVATAGFVLATVLPQGAHMRLPVGAVALGLAFVPGVLLASANPYSIDKTHKLAITVVAALAPLYLLTTPRRQTAFVALHVVVGALVAIGEVLFPAGATETIRLALQGAGTIASGRAVGVAIVVLLVLALTQRRHRALLCLGAAVLSYFLVGSGSRGPMLAVVATVVLVAVLVPGRGRAVRFLVLGVALLGLTWLVLNSGLEGANRIRGTLSGEELGDESRFSIWGEAVATIRGTPQGVGWGDFWTVLLPGARHNPDYVQYAHNAVLETAVEAGWIAAIALAIFIGASLWKLGRARGARAFALFGIALFFTLNAMLSGDVNDNRNAWAALAVAWAVAPAERRAAADPHTAAGVGRDR